MEFNIKHAILWLLVSEKILVLLNDFFSVKLGIGNALRKPCDDSIHKRPRVLTFNKEKNNFHRNRVHKHHDSWWES